MARHSQRRVAVVVALALLLGGVLAGVIGVTRSQSHSARVDPDRALSRSATAGESRRFGFTIDNVADIDNITLFIDSLPRRPVVRIVFDHGRSAEYYAPAVRAIASRADIMGQILDSSAMAKISTPEFLNRTREFLEAFPEEVTVWEVGNEINGEWLGDVSRVRDKVTGAQRILTAAGKSTALTLFYNPNCWYKPENEMFRWVRDNLSEDVRGEFDYAFVSYYESACKNYRPDSWDPVFKEVGDLFPKSLLGFGEVGLRKPVTPATSDEGQRMMTYYYSVRPDMDRFIGGWFWWYARQDLVQQPHHLRSTFQQIVRQG